MKKTIFLYSFVVAYSMIAIAQDTQKNASVSTNPTPAGKPTTRAISPAARSNMLAKTGGMIRSPAEGPAILFLNTQTRVANSVLDMPVEQISKMLRFSTLKKDTQTDDPIDAALTALKDNNTAAVVVLCDSKNQPSLLIAPENRWAMVNVSALADADTSSEILAERTQKEIWRAFGYLMGAANSNFQTCLMKPVFSTKDLDDLKVKSLCPEPFNKIMEQAQKLGIKPQRMTTYRKAVEEGWAPAPTNDFQKAIWNELKK